MSERVLTQRDLNRALLARQFLLERSRAPLTRTLEAIGGLQSQYAPSAYIGLWSRLDGFALPALTRALERRRAVQATLLRSTIHIVSARDYWLFAEGILRARLDWWKRTWGKSVSTADVEAAVDRVRDALASGTRRRDELVELCGGAAVWNGLPLRLVRVPPSGTWDRRRADLYETAESWLGPCEVTEAEGLERLLVSYLTAFGPARLADAAKWAGVDVKTLKPAAERLSLRHFRDEDGKELLDLPRKPLPPVATSAPPRFLPTWDATLLVHARRTQILPERFRPLVFDIKIPNSVPTFLIDGAVAGRWRVERTDKKATLRLEPFEPLPTKEKRALRAEGEALVRVHEPEAASHAVRYG